MAENLRSKFIKLAGESPDFDTYKEELYDVNPELKKMEETGGKPFLQSLKEMYDKDKQEYQLFDKSKPIILKDEKPTSPVSTITEKFKIPDEAMPEFKTPQQQATFGEDTTKKEEVAPPEKEEELPPVEDILPPEPPPEKALEYKMPKFINFNDDTYLQEREKDFKNIETGEELFEKYKSQVEKAREMYDVATKKDRKSVV